MKNQNIFVFAYEPLSGKSLISFSLIRLLQRHFSSVGFFRPVTIASSSGETDQHIAAAHEFFDFEQPIDLFSGIPQHRLEEYLSKGKITKIYEEILNSYKKLSTEFDVIISDSASLKPSLSNFELTFNLELANTLNAQVISVINGQNKQANEIADQVRLATRHLKNHQANIMGIVVNRMNPDDIPTLQPLLGKIKTKCPIIAIIAEDKQLSKPTINDICTLLDGEVLWGHDQLGRIANEHIIAAKHSSAFLAVNEERQDSLVITPGDRQDMLLSCILADQSNQYPSIAGLILTTGIKPDPTISKVINGMDSTPPIIATSLNTFAVAAKLHDAIYPTALFNHQKIKNGTKHVTEALDAKEILTKLNKPQEQKITKHIFKHMLIDEAKKDIQHIVLPEGEDLRVIEACQILQSYGTIKTTLIGDKETIIKTAQDHQITVDETTITSPKDHPKYDQYAQYLYEKRKHKNMTLAIAKDLLMDPVVFATCMVGCDDADGMVSGATHTTSDTVRPALQLIKAKPNIPFIASIFIMCLKNRVVIYGDCAININPTAQQLAHIAMIAAQTAEQLNLHPKVAMLSYSSGSSGSGSSVEKVRQATQLVQSSWPSLKIEGPIQYDAAVDPKVGKQKMPNSEVAGDANVLIFPDLDTGNNTYKAVQRETNSIAIGPILLGLNKPVNDLSRGCESEEIALTCLITAIQAQINKSQRRTT